MHTEKDHEYFENMAIKGAALIFSNREEPESLLISTLTNEFGNNLTARMIYFFLPITFGWVLLKKMGVESFPNCFTLLNKTGDEVEFPISENNLFMGALTLAFKTFEYGYTSYHTRCSHRINQQKFRSCRS